MKQNWKITPKKLRLGYRRIKLLGYIIGEGNLETDPAKLDAVSKLKPPSNVKELQSFLGFINFYRRLVPRFARPARCLTKLLKKEAPWDWGDEQQQAWQELRDVVC